MWRVKSEERLFPHYPKLLCLLFLPFLLYNHELNGVALTARPIKVFIHLTHLSNSSPLHEQKKSLPKILGRLFYWCWVSLLSLGLAVDATNDALRVLEAGTHRLQVGDAEWVRTLASKSLATMVEGAAIVILPL